MTAGKLYHVHPPDSPARMNVDFAGVLLYEQWPHDSFGCTFILAASAIGNARGLGDIFAMSSMPLNDGQLQADPITAEDLPQFLHMRIHPAMDRLLKGEDPNDLRDDHLREFA